ncbi:terpenoid synthase [Nemania sp. FL0916]|nr:terpenoid synthase [Nemania sp. FL0916]
MDSKTHEDAVGYESRQSVLARMRGTSIYIPDLRPLLYSWPQGINPEVERLESEVSDILENVFSSSGDKKRLQKMKSSLFALFTASWWPLARYEKLRILAYLGIWLFAWDDDTDSNVYSAMIDDIDQSASFREETLKYLENSLSFDERSHPGKSTNPIIDLFRPVGDAFSKAYDQRRMDIFLRELRFYINMCEEEQRIQHLNQVPTLEEYVHRRLGSGAVGVCLAATEFANNLDIPDDVMSQGFMEAVWRESNMVIIAANDLLSIKKEFDQEQIDSFVPLLMILDGVDAQQAVDTTVEMIKSAVTAFEEAEKEAMLYCKAHCKERPNVLKDVRQFIDGCKHACTANLNWSLLTGRYDVGRQDAKGGLTVSL